MTMILIKFNHRPDIVGIEIRKKTSFHSKLFLKTKFELFVDKFVPISNRYAGKKQKTEGLLNTQSVNAQIAQNYSILL